MSTSIHHLEPVDPDAILAEHVRTLAKAYRDRLSAAYADPHAAYDAFRDTAARRGLGEAAILMRETPGSFGDLNEGGADEAREAARLGALAYHAQAARADPARAASVLDEAFTEALGQTAGEAAVPRLRAAWDHLSTAYDPDRAAAIALQRPDEFAGVSAEDTERIVRLASARDTIRARAGIGVHSESARAAPLPRSREDERSAPEPLPAAQQARIVAASSAMRARLATAYQYPLIAEARLHSLINEQGIAAIDIADRDPAMLGDLRLDRPGDVVDSVEFARAGLAYARIAYRYHGARFPDRAAEIEALEALEGVSRSARDPQAAMNGVQEAIVLRGAALEEHLDRRRPQRTQGRGPDRGGQGGGDVDLPGDDDPAPVRLREGGDPAVDEAVRAYVVSAEAQVDSQHGQELRTERASAQRAIANLEQQDQAVARARRDFKAAAAKAYANPGAAMAAWDRLVQRENGNLDRARAKAAENPKILGKLRSEPYSGWWGPAAAAVGVDNEQPARDAVPRALDRAVAQTRAEREATDPVSWTTPEGETVHGRDKVRDAAERVIADRTEAINASDARVSKAGGVTRAEEAAQRRFEALSPAQQAAVNSRIGGKGGGAAGGAALPTGVVGKTLRAARVAREVGEGPASL